MPVPLIYLAFTDDWELRGDGSGDIEALQFRPMQRLLDIYERHNVPGTFMAEVMQQLTFRKYQDRFPELAPLADKWDAAVVKAYERGHDVQLHIHPQWSVVDREGGKWKLKGDWSILNYTASDAGSLIESGKRYLENLLISVDRNYKVAAFRSGSSVIAPSPFILDQLVKHGIVFDLSIVGGLRVNTKNVSFDYTACEEDLAPYYPAMSDARRVSDQTEPIVCVPIFHFTGSRRRTLGQLAGKGLAKARARLANGRVSQSGYSKNEWAGIGRSSLPARLYDKALRPALRGKHLTADVGQLTLPLLREMMAAIRSRARSSGLSQIPIILTNHSKYMTDFDGFDHFLAEIKTAEDLRFITLSELAEMLRAGEFEIKRRAT